MSVHVVGQTASVPEGTPQASAQQSLRILAVSATWLGATDYGYVRAFRRAGHSVAVVPESEYFPGHWASVPLRALRRLALPSIVRDFQAHLLAEARRLEPDLFFVFKGSYVEPQSIDAIRAMGAIAINVYPDVSFRSHGPYLPRALPKYDWIFTTKSYGVADLLHELGIISASFMPHGYDPEVHAPVTLDHCDRARYGCDASFIGTWSPKKEALLTSLKRALPHLDLKIWGHQWDRAQALGAAVVGQPVTGREYAKAVTASLVNIAILSEARGEATSGDLTTTRTFEVPAIGGFMLHERNTEVASFFEEGRECAMFGDADELVCKVRHALGQPQERDRVIQAGRGRSVKSGYSVDHKAYAVVNKVLELRSGRGRLRSSR
jgi:hypothetical protein